MATEFVARPAEMDRLLNQRSGEVGMYLEKKGKEIEAFAKARAGFKSGKLKASIHMRYLREPTGPAVKIGSSLSYALLHHEGTKPHMIIAKRTRQLRFSSGGRVIYTRMVRHPGTHPNHYLTDGLYLVK